MDGRTDGQTDERTDGRADGQACPGTGAPALMSALSGASPTGGAGKEGRAGERELDTQGMMPRTRRAGSTAPPRGRWGGERCTCAGAEGGVHRERAGVRGRVRPAGGEILVVLQVTKVLTTTPH